MPVRKYRSVEEMDELLWHTPGSPEHRRALQRVADIAAFFVPRRNLPHGVFRFRSIEEASAQRDAWERLAAPQPARPL